MIYLDFYFKSVWYNAYAGDVYSKKNNVWYNAYAGDVYSKKK
jgi:hypothetical protein